MADLKISALPASTVPLAGTEVLPIVQSGATKQVSITNLTAGRDVTSNRLAASGDYAANGGDLTLTNTNGGHSWRIGDGIFGLVGELVILDVTVSSIRASFDASGNQKINNGNLIAQSIVPNAAPSSKWAIDGTNAALLITIADTATYDLAAGSGVTYLWDNGGNGVGIAYTFYGTVALVYNPALFYSSTIGTPLNVNFYYNAGTGTYRLQNLTGASKSIYVFTMRLRESS